MTSTMSHIAVGIAVVAIFVAGLALHPSVTLRTNLATSVALGIAAALLITAARAFG
jgi:hypothetical protein